jgi:hypothetical protein
MLPVDLLEAGHRLLVVARLEMVESLVVEFLHRPLDIFRLLVARTGDDAERQQPDKGRAQETQNRADPPVADHRRRHRKPLCRSRCSSPPVIVRAGPSEKGAGASHLAGPYRDSSGGKGP